IASGNVANLARPGGNLTGVFLDAPTLCGKWLQYINDVVPNVARVGVLWDVTTGTYQLDAIRAGARARSLNLMVMELRNAPELETALERGLADNPQAIVQLGSPLIRQGGPLIAKILSGRRIPAISQFRTYPDGGGLMSYGPDLGHLYRRLSFQVSRVLRGARPADLPIERPTKFELVINMKTAKALGVHVPRRGAGHRRRGDRMNRRAVLIPPLQGEGGRRRRPGGVTVRSPHPVDRLRFAPAADHPPPYGALRAPGEGLRRRAFFGLLGGAAAWPLAARAQQPAMPVIGYLSIRSPNTDARFLTALRQGLGESGFVEGRN